MSASASAAVAAACVAPRRRNGRLQACTPCRRRKVACDHTLPVCLRCRKRNASEECVFAVQSDSHGLSPKPSSASRAASRHASIGAAYERPRGGPALPTPVLDARERISTRSSAFAGYLGATSFSAVFQETQQHLSSDSPDTVTSSIQVASSTTVEHLTPSQKVDATALKIAANVLSLIPSEPEASRLFHDHINPNDGWVRLAGVKALESLYDTFGDRLRHKTATSMQHMALALFENTSRPLREDYVDPEEWLCSFTGPQMRWETLGTLFTYWALGTFASFETGGTSSTVQSRNLMVVYKNCAADCISLCKSNNDCNTLMVYCIFKMSLIESNISGDASLSYWREHGELVAAATYLGLHAADTTGSEDTVTTHMKRRLAAAVFNIDKVCSVFSGRPPLLSRRYISTPLPLDLSDEELLSPPDVLVAKIASLDAQGWNTSQADFIGSATILRARASMSIIKDEVLEMFLGSERGRDIDRLRQMRIEEQAVYENFPQKLRYSAQEVHNPDLDISKLYSTLLIRLEHLQNLFFIERMLSLSEQSLTIDLFQVSFEMVSSTLVFWTHADKLHSLRGDFEWLVMSFAAPAAGVLCLSLLRPPQPSVGMPETPLQSRSDIIQQISLLIGFLDWVGPSQPNSNLCVKVKEVIKRVLDHTLNSAQQLTASDIAGLDWGTPVDMNDLFNFELLDTFDWLRQDISSL